MFNFPAERDGSLGSLQIYFIIAFMIVFLTLIVFIVFTLISWRQRNDRKKDLTRKDIEGSLASCDPLLQGGVAIQDLFEFSLSGSGQGD